MDVFFGVLIILLIVVTMIHYSETGTLSDEKDVAFVTIILVTMLLGGMVYIRSDKFVDTITTMSDIATYEDQSGNDAIKINHCKVTTTITNRWSIKDDGIIVTTFKNTTCDKITSEQIKKYVIVN